MQCPQDPERRRVPREGAGAGERVGGEPLPQPVIGEHPGEGVTELVERGEHPGDAVDHAAAVAADVGRDRRGATRRGLREREAPALGERRTRDEPRPLVALDEVGVGQLTDEADPVARALGGDECVELGTHRPAAHDLEPQVGHGPLGHHGGPDELVEPLHWRQPSDGHDQGVR